MLLVTTVWLAWLLLVPLMEPTLMLLIGALAGGGFTAGSKFMVSGNVVPAEALVGETLRIPFPPLPPSAVPMTDCGRRALCARAGRVEGSWSRH